PVPDRGAARRGRHGPGLPGAFQGWPGGCGEGGPAGSGRGQRVPAPLRPGGGRGPHGERIFHRRSGRCRSGRLASVARHGVRAGTVPRPGGERVRAVAGGVGAGLGGRARRGAGGDPRRRCRAPGFEALECAAGARRAAGHRLRDLGRARGEPAHPDGHGGGDAGVHVAGAAHWGSSGAAQRRVQPGAVLAFTATGTGPFGTGAPPAMLYRVVHQEPDLSMLPPTLRSVVARCLAKRPEQRPSAPELLDELTGSITAKPTIVEFFAESAWMPDKVARAVHACAAAPQPAPPGTPPAPPRPLPVGTADDPASQQPEAAGTPLQPEGPVAPSTPARADGGAQRSTVPSSEIYRDPPRRHDGGEPARKADALGGTAGRPAGLNRRTALL